MTYKENFKQELQLLDIKILSEYVNSNTKIIVVGTCGHEIERTPDKILRTIKNSGDLKCSKCSRARTQDEKDGAHDAIEKELSSHGVKLISRYTSAKENITVIGQCGHELSRKINQIRESLKRTGRIVCRKCAYSNMGKSRRNSKADIVSFFKKHGAIIDVDSISKELDKVSVVGACGHHFSKRLQDIKKTAKKTGAINCPKCNQKSRSFGEQEISDFVKSLGFDVVDNYKPDGSKGFEADIYIPSKRIGIEYHGLNWHSERVLSSKRDDARQYHLEKAKFFNEKGIQLIQIFENEWAHQKDIIKSIVASKLGCSKKRVFARKCSIKTISPEIAGEFFIKNHRQGHVWGKIYAGLFYEDELVAAISIGISRFSSRYDTELLRFATSLNTSVIGGFSRLLSFVEKKYNTGTMVTYADIRYANIDASKTVYAKNRFTFIRSSSPNYFYYKKGKDVLFSRQSFQKHKLKDKLDKFDQEKTEYENMRDNNFDRIWDCGNHVFVKTIDNTV